MTAATRTPWPSEVDGGAEPPPARKPALHEVRLIPLAELHDSPLNPRTHYDPALLEELADSLHATGQLTPCLVRPRDKGGFEIAAGHRRLRAAKLAALPALLCVVRELTDQEFLECLTIENLQRDDLTPLEEAAGFASLLKECKGYDVPKIALRVGKSTKYVYDRLKLLQVTPEVKKLLEQGEIEAGHAIILARLTPADQKRAIRDVLFQYCEYGDQVEIAGTHGDQQVVSCRELQGWVNAEVRFDPRDTDVLALFPETQAAIAAATEKRQAVVHITYDWNGPATKKGEERVYGRPEWKQADGKPDPRAVGDKKASKTCAYSVVGVFVLGPRRGESVRVCVSKECAIHWPKEKPAPKKADADAQQRESKASAAWKKQEARYKREEAARKALEARWTKASKALTEAVAARVKQLPAGARGVLAELVIDAVEDNFGRGAKAPPVSRGTSADDVVRYLAFRVLEAEITGWGGHRDFPKHAKALGVDTKKILDEAAPVEKPKAGKTAKKKKAAKK